MKTRVITLGRDSLNHEWLEDQTGYIDGYVTYPSGKVCAMVVIGKKITAIPLTFLEVIDDFNEFYKSKPTDENKNTSHPG